MYFKSMPPYKQGNRKVTRYATNPLLNEKNNNPKGCQGTVFVHSIKWANEKQPPLSCLSQELTVEKDPDSPDCACDFRTLDVKTTNLTASVVTQSFISIFLRRDGAMVIGHYSGSPQARYCQLCQGGWGWVSLTSI